MLLKHQWASQLKGTLVETSCYSILRAGLGMVDGVLELIPAAKVGHIGMYRDEKTLKPHEYFVKLPSDIDQRELFIVDQCLLLVVQLIWLSKHRSVVQTYASSCTSCCSEGVKAVQMLILMLISMLHHLMKRLQTVVISSRTRRYW